ncbi:MAG: pitrilysin family protein [Bacteroidales bacterium]|jgi:predicted Zn-dependent peptidase
MINRKSPPEYSRVEDICFTEPEKCLFDNNIEVFTLNIGMQDVVKIEFIFNAGMWEQDIPLVATACNSMLIEGTKKYTADEIAESIDFCGSYIETGINQDLASVSLYTLNKHLAKTLPLVEEIIKNAVFPEKELDIYFNNNKQRFLVKNKKVKYIAKNKFSESLFGKQHPYNTSLNISDFDNVKRKNIIDFYKKSYCSNNCKVIISGKAEKNCIKLVEKYFGGNDWSNKNFFSDKKNLVKTTNKKRIYENKPDAVQSAIRIGRLLFNRKHAGFQNMQILNMLFGGYFGSRLMSNIREDKGYTYGIGSGIVSLKNAGYFFIATEVGVEFCEKTIDEIFREIKRLKDKKVGEDELKLVKNYMLGTILREADGPFSLAEMYKSVLQYGLNFSYYKSFIENIKKANPDLLLELANKYFDEEKMKEIIVGKI